jgi:hypothetical protein
MVLAFSVIKVRHARARARTSAPLPLPAPKLEHPCRPVLTAVRRRLRALQLTTTVSYGLGTA